MTAPLEMRPEAAPEAVLEGAGGAAIEGRSLGRIAWLRLRRDQAAMTGGRIGLLRILVAVIGPFFVQNPDTFHPNLISAPVTRPNPPLGGRRLPEPLAHTPPA